MYFDAPEDTSPIVCGQDTRVVLSFNGLAVLAPGLMPGALMTLCITAMSGAS